MTVGAALTLAVTCSLAIGCAAGAAFATGAGEAPGPRRGDAAVGIWKAVVPPGAMHGEFANNDPLGLAAGVAIPADCSINWVDPDADKLYCFSSATSLVLFLDAPHSYLQRARLQWSQLEKRTR
jgi:hypothetical protein